MPKIQEPATSHKNGSKVLTSKDHFVHFYPATQDLFKSLYKYIVEGLSNGETCIVIAMPDTICQLNKRIRAHHIDLSKAIDDKQYITFDAEELLSKIMTNSRVDLEKFMESIGSLISLATSKDKPVRAFGEMVAILFEDGNIEGVKQLESYWNKLLDEFQFSLYCAYPEKMFDKASETHTMLFKELCSSHSLAVRDVKNN